MSQSTTDKVRWTAADLELFPDNGIRYEIIEGELLVTRAPDWQHQKASTRMSTALDSWSVSTGLGEAVQAPGVVFTDADNVIPDVVWVSRSRLAVLLDAAGHLTGAPELVGHLARTLPFLKRLVAIRMPHLAIGEWQQP